MAVMRVRIADTEAIAQYYPVYPKNINISKVVTLNAGKWSRRKIGIDLHCKNQLEDYILGRLANV